MTTEGTWGSPYTSSNRLKTRGGGGSVFCNNHGRVYGGVGNHSLKADAR